MTAATLAACTGKDKQQSDSDSFLIEDTTSIVNQDTMFADSAAMARDYTNSLSTLVNEVSDGLNEIKSMEKIVGTESFSAESPERKEQMRNDILLIKSSVQDRLNRLAELEEQLTQSEAAARYSEAERQNMLTTIANLKAQLAEQQIMIDNLTAQLDAAHSTIKNLNQKVDSLKTVNNTVTTENIKAKEEAQKAKEEAAKLSNELNECFYAVGSKKELKDHKIIESGFLKKTKVMQSSSIMHSYFTKADKRTLNEINLHSKKAKVLTNHDKQSYSIDDVGGVKVLRIYDQDNFWKYSNYLVVQVD
jgi:chromosome segregation ATPase